MGKGLGKILTALRHFVSIPDKKTRDLKKIRDTKGTFHAKMGTIKDRNAMDLTEADVKHLEPDILECKVK